MQRKHTLAVGGRVVELPCFFPAVSSVKTNLPPAEYLRVLVGLQHPFVLISAYDIHGATAEQQVEIGALLQSSQKNGSVTLLDSGNYESYWNADSSWTRGDFHVILAQYPVPLAFTFDNQSPQDDLNSLVQDIESSVLQDQLHASGTILPIVHCRDDALPEVSYEVARRLRPLMLGVPERLLGDGVLNRGKTVARIKQRLDQLDYFCPLHLLGTGNPLSILIYSLCGADSFDGLEWCQTVVDHSSAYLFHFQQWDFFASQTPLGDLKDLPYSQKALAHNLVFYKMWLGMIRSALLNRKTSELLERFLPYNAIDLVSHELAGLF